MARLNSVELRGVANLALARGGIPCDFEAIRALQDALQRDINAFRVPGEMSGFSLAVGLRGGSSLTLCSESLDNCVTSAPDLAKAIDRWSKPNYPFFELEGCESIVKGLAIALDDPRAARHLFEFVGSNPGSPKATSISEVLTKVGGKHVIGELLTHLKDVASIPSAVELLRYATPEPLRKYRADLITLAKSMPGLDARSRLHAGLALARIEDPVGISTLRDILSDPARVRPASIQSQYWPHVATAIIWNEIFQKPEDYLGLRDFLATLGPLSPLLQSRAMLGDKSVIHELMTWVRTERDQEGQFATALARVESPELYNELDQMATSAEDETRNNVSRFLLIGSES